MQKLLLILKIYLICRKLYYIFFLLNDFKEFQYNYPYYTYMKEGDRIYDSLYLNFNKTRNIGELNL